MKNKTEFWKTPAAAALLAALAAGLLVHLFGLVNILHNNDDIWQQPMGYGAGITSGRWLLTILGDFLSRQGFGFNLPVVNGVLFLVLVALCGGGIVAVLPIRCRKMAALFGALFAVFPAITSVLFFKYTTVYYGLALLLAVLAAWTLREDTKLGLLLSALCTALSLGIYQAYVPVTVTLLVLMLLRQALEGKTEGKKLLLRGLYFCAGLILGVLLYFVFLKISLAVYHTALSDYQGVDNMGRISLSALPKLIRRAVGDVCKLPIYDYCGLANVGLLKLAYVVLAGVSAVLGVYTVLTRRLKPGQLGMTLVLCAALLVALNFVVIMCPDTLIYTLMVESFVLIPCIPMVLLEVFPVDRGSRLKAAAGKLTAVAVAALIFGYGYYANVNDTAMYFANRQVENYWSTLVAQVRMTEGFDTDKQWALIGEISDPLLGSGWVDGVTYGGNRFTDDLLNQYSRLAWVTHYLGYRVPEASEQTIAALAASDEVKAMPCWPNYGSIRVIGDTVVVKFQEMSQG